MIWVVGIVSFAVGAILGFLFACYCAVASAVSEEIEQWD